MLARSKLNSIENKIPEVLMNNETSHEVFTTIINEGKNYSELKETIRMMENQRSDTKKDTLIEEDKRQRIDEIIRKNPYIYIYIYIYTYIYIYIT